jgi:hypothetical protein
MSSSNISLLCLPDVLLGWIFSYLQLKPLIAHCAHLHPILHKVIRSDESIYKGNGIYSFEEGLDSESSPIRLCSRTRSKKVQNDIASIHWSFNYIHTLDLSNFDLETFFERTYCYCCINIPRFITLLSTMPNLNRLTVELDEKSACRTAHHRYIEQFFSNLAYKSNISALNLRFIGLHPVEFHFSWLSPLLQSKSKLKQLSISGGSTRFLMAKEAHEENKMDILSPCSPLERSNLEILHVYTMNESLYACILPLIERSERLRELSIYALQDVKIDSILQFLNNSPGLNEFALLGAVEDEELFSTEQFQSDQRKIVQLFVDPATHRARVKSSRIPAYT